MKKAKININENEQTPIDIKALIKNDNINNGNILLQKDIDTITSNKINKIKAKECDFNKIDIDNISLGKYANVNIINCIEALNRKKEGYFKNMFTKFDTENKIFEITFFKKGRSRNIILDNKKLKDSPFIKCPDNNFWIYLIEKGFAFLYKHYINIIPLLASQLFPFLCSANIRSISHSTYPKKELYDVIKEHAGKNKHFIVFAEKKGEDLFDVNDGIDETVPDTNNNGSTGNNNNDDNISNFEKNKEQYISFFINRAFKTNGHKYIEMFFPVKPSNIQLTSNILEDDIKQSKKFFTEEVLKDGRYYFLRYDTYFKKFAFTHILNYNPNYFYDYKRIVLSDRNINLLKFKITQPKTKIELSIKLKSPFLFRFVLSKLIIIENFIRKVHTMSSQGDNESAGSNSYYEGEDDCNFEYIASLYKFDMEGTIEQELEPGIYCLLFNVYTNNDTIVNICSYSSSQIEFLEESEKISEQKLTSQIKSLFVSYIKTKDKATTEQIENHSDLIHYSSLINENFGFSISVIENKSEDQIMFVTMCTETEGMNLITKDYSPISNSINLVIPPKNTEMVIFEWEKTLNEIVVFFDLECNLTKIDPVFKESDFNMLPKKYISNTKVYYVEAQFRRGVFLIFVNEDIQDNMIVYMKFEKLDNLEYKGKKGIEIEGKEYEIDLPIRSYARYKLMSVDDKDFSFKINLKITKNKAANQSQSVNINNEKQEDNISNNNNNNNNNNNEDNKK